MKKETKFDVVEISKGFIGKKKTTASFRAKDLNEMQEWMKALKK